MGAIDTCMHLKSQRERPVWKLLAADNAPAILAIFSQYFKKPDEPVAASDFLMGVQHSLVELQHEGVEMLKSADEYVKDWRDSKFLERCLVGDEAGNREAYRLTPDTLDALRFVEGLSRPHTKVTGSMLTMITSGLVRLDEETDGDATHRIEAVDKQMKELADYREALLQGKVRTLDEKQALEDLRSILAMCDGLQGDFLRVAERLLDFALKIRLKSMGECVSKKKVLEKFFQEIDLLRDSPEGRAFSSFWKIINDDVEYSRLRMAIENLLKRPFSKDLSIEERNKLRKLPSILLRKGAEVHKKSAVLSKRLNHFVTSNLYAEESRLNQLLGESIRFGARLGSSVNAVASTGLQIEGMGCRVNSISRIELFNPASVALPAPLERGEVLEVSLSQFQAKVAQNNVDREAVCKKVSDALEESPSATVGDVLEKHPARQGLPEVMLLFGLAVAYGVPDNKTEEVSWVSDDGVRYRAKCTGFHFIKENQNDLSRRL